MQDSMGGRGAGWRHGLLLVLVLAVTTACSGSASTQRAEPPAAAAAKVFPPPELQWFRTSAERQAAYAQAFRYAWHLIENRDKGSAPWAVVIDADETILDNSEYKDRVARLPTPPSSDEDERIWDAWVREEKAPAFSPARSFLERVRTAGGRIVVVTNRLDATCDPTRRNLVAEKIPFDAVLCAPSWTDTAKQPRFDAVTNGSAVPSAGPLVTLLYVGDNIKDCPRQTQSSFDERLFGERCIVLPNPMYGSWESNTYH